MKGKGEKNWLCYILKTSPGAYSEPKLYGINPVLSLRPGWIHQSCCFYCILPITRRAVSLFNLHISVVRCLASCYYCLQKVKKGKEIEMKRVRRHHSCEIITRYAFAPDLRDLIIWSCVLWWLTFVEAVRTVDASTMLGILARKSSILERVIKPSIVVSSRKLQTWMIDSKTKR